MKTFPSRLLKVRSSLTQKDAASRVGIAQQHWARYESGAVEPKIGVLVHIAEAFQVSADWLLGLTDERSPRASGVSVVGDANVVASAPHARATSGNASSSSSCIECAKKDEIIRNLSATLAAVTKGR